MSKKQPPPTTSSITVAALRASSCGVHFLSCSEEEANAILRNHKSATIADAALGIQRGDIIIFRPHLGLFGTTPSSFHPLFSRVFKVTSVSDVPHTLPDHHLSLVCFYRKLNSTFHEGDVGGKFLEDTITTEKKGKESD